MGERDDDPREETRTVVLAAKYSDRKDKDRDYLYTAGRELGLNGDDVTPSNIAELQAQGLNEAIASIAALVEPRMPNEERASVTGNLQEVLAADYVGIREARLALVLEERDTDIDIRGIPDVPLPDIPIWRWGTIRPGVDTLAAFNIDITPENVNALIAALEETQHDLEAYRDGSLAELGDLSPERTSEEMAIKAQQLLEQNLEERGFGR